MTMDATAAAATTAKKRFVALIEYINANTVAPPDLATMEAMRELAAVWTSSVPNLTSMMAARTLTDKLDAFFANATATGLATLWGDYKHAAAYYHGRLTLDQQGC